MFTTRYHQYTIIIAGAFILAIPALINGYPFVNSDEASYLEAGFQLYMPWDRPFMYGLFLRVFSLNGFSLWFALAFQALVMSFLLFEALKTLCGKFPMWKPITVVAILTFTTPFGWLTSELTPDIWTTICLLAFFLILINENNRITTVVLYLIFGCGVATHMSHFLIFSVLIVVVFLLRRYFPFLNRVGVKKTLLLLLLINVLSVALNSRTISSSKNAFLVASMLEKGILKKYLDEYCVVRGYRLCSYKDQLPSDPNIFLWDERSPFYLQGGWKGTRDDYSAIISGTLTDPKYLLLHIRESLKATAMQLVNFKLADTYPFPEGSHVHEKIEKYLPADLADYENALQHQSNIVEKLSVVNLLVYASVLVGVVVLIFAGFMSNGGLQNVYWFFVIISLCAIVVNVWDCATFAQVNGRYGARVMWLIPFCASVYLFGFGTSAKTDGVAK